MLFFDLYPSLFTYSDSSASYMIKAAHHFHRHQFLLELIQHCRTQSTAHYVVIIISSPHSFYSLKSPCMGLQQSSMPSPFIQIKSNSLTLGSRILTSNSGVIWKSFMEEKLFSGLKVEITFDYLCSQHAMDTSSKLGPLDTPFILSV